MVGVKHATLFIGFTVLSIETSHVAGDYRSSLDHSLKWD